MDNLLWGLQMTALGMGLVFGLLALLWGLLTLVLRFDREPAAALSTPAPATPAPARAAPMPTVTDAPPAAQDLDPELVAAILVATLEHRAMRRRQAAPVMRIYWPGSLLHASRWVGAGRTRQNRSWFRGAR